MVWTIIIILLSAADQLIKAVVNNRLVTSDRIVVLDGFFYLINRKNSGAAWSFLAEPDWGIYVLTALSIVMTAALLWVLLRVRPTGLRLCLSLIIAGSIGNMVDRIRLGAVTDYLDFHFGSYVFPTFNLADMLIVIGTGLLCILLLKNPHLIDQIFPPGKEKIPLKGEDNSHAAKHPDQ